MTECGLKTMVNNLTANGVCYDLERTPFVEDWGNLVFHFSSETHARKFREKAKVKEEWLCDSLSRRFHISIDASALAVIQLYMQIEKRGFFIVSKRGRIYRCPQDLNFYVQVQGEV